MRFVEPIRDVEQLEEFKEYLKDKSERDYLLFLMGITTGFRVSDLLMLKVRDVEGTHIKVMEQKTKKMKRVIISPDLKKVLKEYLKDKKANDYLFLSKKRTKSGKKQPITRVRAYQIFNEAADAIGIRDNIGTHTMRKTFGYHFYKQFGDVATLQRLFNHSSQATTLMYIGITQDDMDEKISKMYR